MDIFSWDDIIQITRKRVGRCIKGSTLIIGFEERMLIGI